MMYRLTNSKFWNTMTRLLILVFVFLTPYSKEDVLDQRDSISVNSSTHRVFGYITCVLLLLDLTIDVCVKYVFKALNDLCAVGSYHNIHLFVKFLVLVLTVVHFHVRIWDREIWVDGSPLYLLIMYLWIPEIGVTMKTMIKVHVS